MTDYVKMKIPVRYFLDEFMRRDHTSLIILISTLYFWFCDTLSFNNMK